MKKQYKIYLSTILSLIIILLVVIYNKNSNYDDDTETNNNVIKEERMLSMMLETEAGSGNYEMTTASSWPTTGYKFNATLSKCENGSEVSWNSEKKTVVMTGNMSDKCYIYFDKVSLTLALNNYTFSWNSIDGASSYQIYSDGELLTTTTNTSIDLYGYYNDAGTYSITAKALNSSNEVLLDSNVISYNLEQLNIDLSTKYCKIHPTLIDTGGDYYRYRYEVTYLSPEANVTMDLLSLTNNNYLINYYYYSVYDSHPPEYDYSIFSNVFDRNFCNYSDDCLTSNLNTFSISNNYIKIWYDISTSSLKGIYLEGYTVFHCLIQIVEPGKIGTDWYYIEFWNMCLSSNTEVYVYDKKKKKFKKKKIGDLSYDDEILCWNFDKGEFAIAKPVWIKKCEQTNKYNLLKFSDGSTLETIDQHRIYNAEKGMFTYPMSDETPIGTTTFNSSGEYIKLVSKEVIEKPIDYYNVMTEYHINLFANDILTSSRLSNMYKIENMKYVYEEKRDNGYDLSKYNEKLVKALRLKEQNIEEPKLKTYVDNMLKLMKK